MPAIRSGNIGFALDMHGCPNRCRHCWLPLPNGHLTEQDLRWTVEQFGGFRKEGEDKPFFEKMSISSWVREPDFSDDYERLAELEAELGNGKPNRSELLSIWRLARDDDYAQWAKKIGPDTCQISFFGVGETQDWFHRRKGAFQDSLAATERLLDVGMKPRWQFFLTKKILPDLDKLMKLVDRMRIRERVRDIGGEFVMFIYTPDPTGYGRQIAHLHATLDDTKLVPGELVASTRKHLGTEKIWTTEAETVSRILTDPEAFGVPYPYPEPELWFFISSKWDVFANIGTTDPWWSLGNLKKDPVSDIINRFENDAILPLALNRVDVLVDMTKRFGDPESQAIVNGMEQYWFERHFEVLYGEDRGGV